MGGFAQVFHVTVTQKNCNRVFIEFHINFSVAGNSYIFTDVLME
jgi:hypothetical protein